MRIRIVMLSDMHGSPIIHVTVQRQICDVAILLCVATGA